MTLFLMPDSAAPRLTDLLEGRVVLTATGHRPQDIPGYWDDRFPELVALACTHVEALAPGVVVAGGAIGWNQAVAQAALDLGLPLVVAAPFVGQHCRWPGSVQALYIRQARGAALAVTLRPRPADRDELVTAMHGRNAWMLGHAHHLLAFHSGSTRGGTAHTVGLAARRGLPLTNAFGDWVA